MQNGEPLPVEEDWVVLCQALFEGLGLWEKLGNQLQAWQTDMKEKGMEKSSSQILPFTESLH